MSSLETVLSDYELAYIADLLIEIRAHSTNTQKWGTELRSALSVINDAHITKTGNPLPNWEEWGLDATAE